MQELNTEINPNKTNITRRVDNRKNNLINFNTINNSNTKNHNNNSTNKNKRTNIKKSSISKYFSLKTMVIKK